MSSHASQLQLKCAPTISMARAALPPYKPETLAPFYGSGVFAGLPIVN